MWRKFIKVCDDVMGVIEIIYFLMDKNVSLQIYLYI